MRPQGEPHPRPDTRPCVREQPPVSLPLTPSPFLGEGGLRSSAQGFAPQGNAPADRGETGLDGLSTPEGVEVRSTRWELKETIEVPNAFQGPSLRFLELFGGPVRGPARVRARSASTGRVATTLFSGGGLATFPSANKAGPRGCPTIWDSTRAASPRCGAEPRGEAPICVQAGSGRKLASRWRWRARRRGRRVRRIVSVPAI
jgi:hypothetical protein